MVCVGKTERTRKFALVGRCGLDWPGFLGSKCQSGFENSLPNAQTRACSHYGLIQEIGTPCSEREGRKRALGTRADALEKRTG